MTDYSDLKEWAEGLKEPTRQRAVSREMWKASDIILSLLEERETAWEDMKAEVIKAIDDYERDWDVPWRDDLKATIRDLTEYPLTNRIL